MTKIDKLKQAEHMYIYEKQPVSDDLNLISWAYESLNDLLTGAIF